MKMENEQLRKEIIDACMYLQETGLIARTWGNVSARIDNSKFIITPSGLDYNLTKENDLVVVNIDDCSYDKSQRKPSSEKLVHASAYKLRKDINYIVHTHQFYASAICALSENIKLKDGTIIPCAKYGLPSTKRLQKNCEEVFKEYPTSNIFLLSKHGAITFGKTMKEALDNANLLEKECKELFNKKVNDFYIPENMEAYLDDYAQMFPLKDETDEVAIKMVKEKNAAACLYASEAKPLGFFDRYLQHIIYELKYSKLRKDSKTCN